MPNGVVEMTETIPSNPASFKYISCYCTMLAPAMQPTYNAMLA